MPVSKTQVMEHLGISEADFERVYKTFMTELHSRIGQMRQSVAEQNGERIAQAAHSLQGASANIGFFDCYKKVVAIENAALANQLDQVQQLVDQLEREETQLGEVTS